MTLRKNLLEIYILLSNHVLEVLMLFFADFMQALMSLFVLASKDGWVSIMYTGLDAVGVDLQVSNVC